MIFFNSQLKVFLFLARIQVNENTFIVKYKIIFFSAFHCTLELNWDTIWYIFHEHGVWCTAYQRNQIHYFSDKVYAGKGNMLILEQEETFTFKCYFKLQMYPFDRQICAIEFILHDLTTDFGILIKVSSCILMLLFQISVICIKSFLFFCVLHRTQNLNIKETLLW